MKEHLLKIVEGNPDDVVQRLKAKGIRVLHRFKDTLVVEGDPSSDPEVLESTRVVEAKPLDELPEDVKDDELQLLAYRLRQTEKFRRRKGRRATEDEDWDTIFERMAKRPSSSR
jgi:hypothetical protein